MKNAVLISIGFLSLLLIPIISFAQQPPQLPNICVIPNSEQNKIENIFQQTRYKLSVTGTDYDLNSDVNITLALKVTDNGIPINNSFCDANIYFSNKSLFASTGFNFVPTSRGLYIQSLNIQVPNEIGVYPVDAQCVRPVNSTTQNRFLSNTNDNTKLQSFVNNHSKFETIENIDQDTGIGCLQNRFTESILDYQSDNLTQMLFLTNITNIRIWANSTGGSEFWRPIVNFYRVNDVGTVKIGSTFNESLNLPSAPREIIFQNVTVDSTWDSTSLLQVEFCAIKLSGGLRDISIIFNSTTTDSRFTINSLKTSGTVDFVLSGSSEVVVHDSTSLTTALLTNELQTISNHNLCIDNSTLLHIKTVKVNNKINNINVTEPCEFGCDVFNNQCNPNPTTQNLIFVGIIILAFTILFLLVRRFR